MKQTPESTADYLDRHMIQAMKELAKEGFFNLNKKQTMKQTAVKWLIENIAYIPMGFEIDIIEQAKAMEKEQMNEIHLDGIEQGYNMRYEQEKKMKHGKDV